MPAQADALMNGKLKTVTSTWQDVGEKRVDAGLTVCRIPGQTATKRRGAGQEAAIANIPPITTRAPS